MSNWQMVGTAVFSSLPQPIGAVIAFAFVRWAEAFLPFGFGFAAGAMVYLYCRTEVNTKSVADSRPSPPVTAPAERPIFTSFCPAVLVVTEFIPEALEMGAELPHNGRRELLVGLAAGILAMHPLMSV